MKRSVRSVISQLQRDRRFKGTCPNCEEEFFLTDAVLFALDESQPEEALAAVRAARARIRERRQELVNKHHRMTERAQKTSQAVNIGKIVEKIVPSFSDFAHTPGDCRALFEPIDYVIFSGLSLRGCVNSLLFVDVKSGGALLTTGQRSVRDAIAAGRLDFAVIEKEVRNG